MTTLIARCASLGWTLRPDGAGWLLLGNGADAAFGSTESLEAWLDKQEKGRGRIEPGPQVEQLVMELEPA